MANEIVKYDNVMNELEFKGFEQRDFDLLMALCSRMRDLGETEQVFEYDYLMELIGWDKSQDIALFHKALIRMNEKLSSIKATIVLSDDEDATLVLFPTFRRNIKKRTLKVCVNKDFKFILNQIGDNFTKFELKEYVGLDGRYAKQLYSQIKQRYKLRGRFWQPTVEELRQALSIPESYTTKRIYTLIIEPSLNTLRSCKGLKELQVEVIKEHRRGNPVKAYRFTWTPSDQLPGQTDLETGMEEMRKYKATKENKPKKNNFSNIESSPSTPKTQEEWESFEKSIIDN